MLIKINGRTQFFSSITKIEKVGRGRWEVTRNGDIYTVEGGKAAGGSARDWFVESRHYTKALWTNSLVESLKMIDNT